MPPIYLACLVNWRTSRAGKSFILLYVSVALFHWDYTYFTWMHTHCLHVFLCRLSLCEKALAEYLDTKRLAFPRFYFISSADLLDILSNGTNPHQVPPQLCARGVTMHLVLQSVPCQNIYFLNYFHSFVKQCLTAAFRSSDQCY